MPSASPGAGRDVNYTARRGPRCLHPRRERTGSGQDFIKNGDRWTLATVHPHGDVTLACRTRGAVRVPAEYAMRDLDLGYAATVHRAQGVTVDTPHVVVTEADTRETLYVASSRARQRTALYLAIEDERLEITAPATDPVEMLSESCMRPQPMRHPRLTQAAPSISRRLHATKRCWLSQGELETCLASGADLP